MKNIAIYGAGGLGREVACLIKRINEVSPTWNLIGFFDDIHDKGDENRYGRVLGGIDELNSWGDPISIVIAVGSPEGIESIVSKITNNHIDFPNLIAPDFTIIDKDSFSIGKGNIIQACCSVSCDVAIGDFNVLNGTVVFGHDVKMGSYNVIMPNVRVSGWVNIGNTNLFGVGSIIMEKLLIKDNMKLSPGSVLLTNPKSNSTYMGNPAKIFKY